MPYYRQIAGALLFLFFVLFGIQPGFKQALETHYYIILGILQQPAAFAGLMVLFALYTIKCITYFYSYASKDAYSFLYQLNTIMPSKRFIYLAFAAFMLLLPVLTYGIIVTTLALATGYILSGLLVFSLLVVLIFSTTLACFLRLKKPGTSITYRLLFLPVIKTGKSIAWFLMAFMLRKQFRALLLVKLLSFSVLYFFVLNDRTVFEERILWLLFTLCLIAHGVIIYRNFYFLENELVFYRNLPLHPVQTLLSLLVTYFLIYLPEIWALRALWLVHGNTYSYLCMISGGPAILVLLHVLLYTDEMSMDSFLPLLFGVWLLFFFFSFSGDKWLVPAVALSGSAIVFYTSFRNFEKKEEVERLE